MTLKIQYLFRTGNKSVIHAYTHETFHLNFSKAFRRKIKLLLYSDRAKISLQKCKLKILFQAEKFLRNFNEKFRARTREGRVHFQSS